MKEKKTKLKTMQTPYTDIEVAITIKTTKSGWLLTGRLRRTQGTPLQGYPTCRRNVKTKEELDTKVQEIYNSLVKKFKGCGGTTPPVHKSDDLPAPEISAEGLRIQNAFDALGGDLSKYIGSWREGTAKTALRYFEGNILPILVERADESLSMDTTLCIHNKISEVFRSKGGKSKEAGLISALIRHLQEAEMIYNAMDVCAAEPLPIFDFSVDAVKRSKQEQFKSFSEADRQKIIAYLEELIRSRPLLAKCLIIMFDAGLRTGEACAVDFDNIHVCTTSTGIRYGTYTVVAQADPLNPKKRIQVLKTGAAYRLVLLSGWGLRAIECCNDSAPETGGDDLPFTRADIGKAFQTMAQAIGIKPQNLVQYWAVSGGDENSADSPESNQMARLTDYILRRDRASRWKNLCAMNSEDIDTLLGHTMSGKSRYYYNLKRNAFSQKSNLDRLAELNENYPPDRARVVPILEDTATAEYTDIPAARNIDLRNDLSKPVTIRIMAQTREPGDSLICNRPSSCRQTTAPKSIPYPQYADRAAFGHN